jgi:nucleoside-diphosphate-sugar epimerase
MSKKILIVGGTGFIGYHLAKKSLLKKWNVTSVSLNLPQKQRYLKKVNYIMCDISKKKNVTKSLKKNFDYVVNLGGHVNHKDKKKTYNTHYIGCKNLVNFFLKKKLRSFIQIGSSSEYGLHKAPHKESFKCKPVSIYGKSKLLSSTYLVKLFKEKKFPATILRFYQVYGPKQDLNRFLPVVISGCLKNKKFPCSHGTQTRDFLHINDAVEAIFKSIKSKNTKGKIFNIGTGKPILIKKIINMIQVKTKGGKPLFGKINLRKEESLKSYPDINESKKKLGWIPKVNFLKGLDLTIKSYYNEK